tara:strand:- start:358 stop:579 length:222 start_codon:yes stop_codon:yes gene_type:complete
VNAVVPQREMTTSPAASEAVRITPREGRARAASNSVATAGASVRMRLEVIQQQQTSADACRLFRHRRSWTTWL